MGLQTVINPSTVDKYKNLNWLCINNFSNCGCQHNIKFLHIYFPIFNPWYYQHFLFHYASFLVTPAVFVSTFSWFLFHVQIPYTLLSKYCNRKWAPNFRFEIVMKGTRMEGTGRHNVIHKITSSMFLSSNLCKNGEGKCKLVKDSHTAFKQSLWKFYGQHGKI